MLSPVSGVTFRGRMFFTVGTNTRQNSASSTDAQPGYVKSFPLNTDSSNAGSADKPVAIAAHGTTHKARKPRSEAPTTRHYRLLIDR
jgi:hypothetical protein